MGLQWEGDAVIFFQFFFAIAWFVLALRVERSAPFLRAAWILFACSTGALALSRLQSFQAPGPLREGDFIAALFFLACAIVFYIISLVRKEPQKARRWLWDRSYAE